MVRRRNKLLYQPSINRDVAFNVTSEQKRKNPQIPAENEGFEEVKAVGLEPTTYGLKVRGKHRGNTGVSSSVAQKVATDIAENEWERVISVDDVDPDLARLLVAWPKLSATAKRMILAALDADQPDDLRSIVAPSGKGVTR